MITVSSLTSKVVPPAKFSDGPPPLTGVPNGVHTSISTSTSSSPIRTATGSIRVRPQYELEEECIEDKVTVIHTKKRMLPTQRRLSECSTEQKRPQSDPNPVTEMAKVTVVSKRAASTESAEQPLSPKGASQMPKRRKRKFGHLLIGFLNLPGQSMLLLRRVPQKHNDDTSTKLAKNDS